MRRAALLLAALASLAHAQDYPSSVNDYLRRFDADGDGRIDMREYVDYLSRGFRLLDADGDGVLGGGELPSGPRRMPRTLAAFQADLRAQFRRTDRNRDGYLSAQELARPPG